MNTSRMTIRSARALRVRPSSSIRQVRHASTQPSINSNPGSSGAFTGAIAGAVSAGVLTYGYYRYSGAGQVVDAANKTKQYLQNAQNKIKQSAPEPNQAIQWLRETALSFAGPIPGAKGYVNSTFDELDKIRDNHGEEVEKIVKEAYTELKGLSNQKVSLDTAEKAWVIIEKYTAQIYDLASDAASDILDQHPEFKEKFSGNLDQLKSLGDKYGPDAKKQIDELWGQIQDITKSGWSSETAAKIKELIEDKTKQISKLGDDIWDKGMEQIKPQLEKNPKIKELVEKNKDVLKDGNAQQFFDKAKDALKSGDTKGIEGYVQEITDKAKEQGSGGLEQYLSKLPGGEDVFPKLGQLSDLAQKHGKEAEKIFKETLDELQQVLQKKVGEAQKLADKAKKDGEKAKQ